MLSVLCLGGIRAQVWLHPNRGQWTREILYKVNMDQGDIFIDKNGFTYILDNLGHGHDGEKHEDEPKKCQILFSHFENSTWSGEIAEGKQSTHYNNYYYGSDQRNWKSEIHDLESASLLNYYAGIDLKLEGMSSSLKYSFIVSPGADPSVIVSNLEGFDEVKLEDGNLHLKTQFGVIIEKQPVAWNLLNGKKVPVKVRFRLEGKKLSFELPEDYDHAETLVIDPDIVFSTFSGSTMDNWGMTATGDTQGCLYGGGIGFVRLGASSNGNYPTTPGAFDVTFNGGVTYNWGSGQIGGFDVTISKFSANGTQLLYSTYLGGTGNETVHSLVTDDQNNLYAIGVTSSTDFPVTSGCFDNSFAGGPTVITNELGFPGGTDMYVVHFNQAGSALVGSTFVGGTNTDGINTGALFANYGDPFRGEIIWKNNAIYVASSTLSSDFPTVNASQNFLNGTQDAVVFKMNPALTNMFWSTYLGGSGLDSGNGLQTSSSGDVFVTGGSTSGAMGFPIGFTLANNGGTADGYVAKLNGTTSVVMAGTFIGTNEFDQSYFVQLDLMDQVYLYGQTEGSIPISSGCYGNANSGQFVAKFNSNLTSRVWTTVIGAGTGHTELSPTAFLVSNCNDIYLAGWGGTINTNFGPSQADFSTSSGFPVTTDAFQSNTNGSNFWIAVLDADAAFLKYATFIGGTSSSYNHVDGGTSRFDKNGNIYHAVCGACGASPTGFSTTPGVWSPTNPSWNCNLAVFKFELSSTEAVVATPDPLVCMPDPVIFNNNSANGNYFHWSFGDGAESNEVNPSHAYSAPGQYEVTLVVTDTNECFAPDSITFIVNIGNFEGGVVNPQVQVCSGESAQLEAYGGATYVWSPAQFLNNANIPNPVATVSSSTLFSCIVSDSCGIDTVQVQVIVSGGSVVASNDTSVCLGGSIPLFVNGIVNVLWSPATYLDDPTSATPTSTPTNSIQYTVSGETPDGCPLSEVVNITVFFDPPVPNMPDTLSYCIGTSGTVTVSGGETYLWSPPANISSTTSPTVTISTPTEQYYYCDFTNACATRTDSMFVNLIELSITAGNDTIVCPGEEVEFFAEGALLYSWFPNVTPVMSDYSEVSTSSLIPRTYVVTGTDAFGCTAVDSVRLNLFPQPVIQANADVYAFMGDEVQLSATSSTPGPFVWSPAEFLSCVVCTNPVANPDQNFTYTVTYTDENGCSASDVVGIYYDPVIYVPNAFTPDGNSTNADFFAVAANIRDFKMEIFNRWGELIYTGDLQSKSWDGSYKNLPCPDGVYVWKITYKGLWTEEIHHLVGHVSLLR
jgi:gliding motility-associated-like protein